MSAANTPSQAQGLERLVFRSYLQMIRNAVGTQMFRNFYVRSAEGESDATADGKKSCAFFVSSVLSIWGKLDGGIHGTVTNTEADLHQTTGWRQVTEAEAQPGDVLVWQAVTIDGEPNEHIGFYIGNRRAISTSYKTRSVIQHDLYFGGTKRPLKAVYRQTDW